MKQTFTYSDQHSSVSFLCFVAANDNINWLAICRKVVTHITKQTTNPVSITISTYTFKGSKRVVLWYKAEHGMTKTIIDGTEEAVVESAVRFLKIYFPDRKTFYIRFNF